MYYIILYYIYMHNSHYIIKLNSLTFYNIILLNSEKFHFKHVLKTYIILLHLNISIYTTIKNIHIIVLDQLG